MKIPLQSLEHGWGRPEILTAPAMLLHIADTLRANEVRPHHFVVLMLYDMAVPYV